jgi:cyclophilin family peptidyl-prolyl cis-trans isomerase
MRRSPMIVACLLTMILAVLSSVGFSQDEAPQATWDELLQAREAAFDKLRAIRDGIEDAAPEEQQQMVTEYQQTVQQLTTQLLPQLEQLLPAALEEKPDDPKVLEIANEVMRFAFGRNQFEKAQGLADMLRAKDPENEVAVNIAGVSRFANHEFEEAHQILKAADEQDQLIPDLGGRFLESAENYVEYWKEEQQIREREAAATGDEALPRVELKTSKGDVVVELFENEAPNTVANFISLVEKEFYNGLTFHRVIPSFMAQGGCPHSREGDPQQPGTGGPGYNIKCECYEPDARRHFAGTLSMAHAGRDTGGSQFFITHLPTPHLDRELVPDSVHTVFGRVVEGLDIVRDIEADDQIVSATVLRKRDHDYVPETIDE